MRPTELADRMREALGARSIDVRENRSGDDSAVQDVWEAFKEVARATASDDFDEGGLTWRVIAAPDGDLLLFETGVRDSKFALFLTRQFMFETSDGEYLGMRVLSVVLEVESDQQLLALPSEQIWGNPGAVEDWFEQVEGSRAFVAIGASRSARFAFGFEAA